MSRRRPIFPVMVCEAHPNVPFDTCPCGAPGMPAPLEVRVVYQLFDDGSVAAHVDRGVGTTAEHATFETFDPSPEGGGPSPLTLACTWADAITVLSFSEMVRAKAEGEEKSGIGGKRGSG